MYIVTSMKSLLTTIFLGFFVSVISQIDSRHSSRVPNSEPPLFQQNEIGVDPVETEHGTIESFGSNTCLLYTSDAADE